MTRTADLPTGDSDSCRKAIRARRGSGGNQRCERRDEQKLGAVVVKLGDQGSVYCGPDRTFATPPFPVRAVDSTAAGDTFNAALAVSLAEGAELEHALRFANAAAAISVTRPGAQTSAPSRAEVESLLAQMSGPVR